MNPAPHPLYDAPDFESFWRAYVMAHRSPATQRAHAVATPLMLACVVQGVRTRRLRWFALAPLVEYGIAQSSHRVVEHNRSQPWRDTPRHLRAAASHVALHAHGTHGARGRARRGRRRARVMVRAEVVVRAAAGGRAVVTFGSRRS